MRAQREEQFVERVLADRTARDGHQDDPFQQGRMEAWVIIVVVALAWIGAAFAWELL